MEDQTKNNSLARQSVLERLSILDVYQFVAGFSATTNAVHGGFMVRCPTAEHDDNHPSCVLNTDKSSWKCFGCGESGGKLKMVIASGKASTNAEAAMWLERNSGIVVEFRKQPPPKPEHMRGADCLLNKTETGRFIYRDEEGNVLYTVVRYDGQPAFEGNRTKNFEFWATSKTKRKVPYNLPDLIANAAAVKPRAIHVLEGEGKAEIMRRLGYIATSGYGGATWDWPTTWTRFFEHAAIIFVHQDSDKQGRKFASKIATLLASPANKIVPIDYFPNLDDGSDVIDFLQSLKDQKIGATEAKKRINDILRVALRKMEQQ